MAFEGGAWAADGFPLDGALMRLAARGFTRNTNGVLEIGDCRVMATDPPSNQVVIKDGAVIARGREVLWQGSYYGYNVGDILMTIPPTSGAERHDLIYGRVEDPTFNGSPWIHAATDPLWYPQRKESVAANTKDIPSGETGVAFARLDLPAGTTIITQEMIIGEGVRKVADPKSYTDQVVVKGTWDSPDTAGNVVMPDWEEFPNGADWLIDVPPWAGQVVFSYVFSGLQFRKASSGSEARGYMRINWAGTGYDSDGYWIRSSVQDYTRTTIGGATGGSGIAVPEEIRGTTQVLKMENQESNESGAPFTGYLEADGASVLAITYTFREVPRNDVPDRSPA